MTPLSKIVQSKVITSDICNGVTFKTHYPKALNTSKLSSCILWWRKYQCLLFYLIPHHNQRATLSLMAVADGSTSIFVFLILMLYIFPFSPSPPLCSLSSRGHGSSTGLSLSFSTTPKGVTISLSSFCISHSKSIFFKYCVCFNLMSPPVLIVRMIALPWHCHTPPQYITLKCLVPCGDVF